MKNKLEFYSEACFKDIDVPKSSLEICRLCLALFKSVFFMYNSLDASLLFSGFYLAVRVYAVTVIDSFIYWFLCEAEKKH